MSIKSKKATPRPRKRVRKPVKRPGLKAIMPSLALAQKRLAILIHNRDGKASWSEKNALVQEQQCIVNAIKAGRAQVTTNGYDD